MNVIPAAATPPTPLHAITSSSTTALKNNSLHPSVVFVYSSSPPAHHDSFPEHEYLTSLVRRAHAQEHHLPHHQHRSRSFDCTTPTTPTSPVYRDFHKPFGRRISRSTTSLIRAGPRPLSPVTEVSQVPDLCSSTSTSSDSDRSATEDSTKPPRRVRRLIARMALSRINTQAVEPAPGSPPDLTNSKSSKSSSFQSSVLSDITGPNDISHFEDITLDDVNAPPHHHIDVYTGRRLLGKQPSMSSLSSARSPIKQYPPAAPFRELTSSSALRSNFPVPVVSPKNVQQGMPYTRERASSTLTLPSRRPMNRGLRSPSAQSLGQFNRNYSRSPSPGRRIAYGGPRMTRSASSSRASSTSTLGMRNGSLAPPVRRESWTCGKRKTVAELEAEYDDKDDDIPEDAVVFNIPISPRMPHDRSVSTSPQSTSPARESGFTIQQQQQLKHVSAPAAFPRRSSSKISLRSERSIYESYPLPERTSSYSSALADLDDDARRLTEAFEAQATIDEQHHEDQVQKGEIVVGRESQDNGVGKLRSTKTFPLGKVELPPLQRPDIMMDPLPISKEKEAHLSRTRPSHLPPKSKEEEERHLKEYQKMMAAAQEAEKKRIAKLRSDLDAKDLEERSKVNLWRQLLLPQWDVYRQDRRTRELWWRGVPPACRAKAWLAGIGNELELTADSFQLALSKGEEQLRREAAADGEHHDGDDDASSRGLTQILAALSAATWPEEKLFQPGMPCYDAHHAVLLAYAMYRPDVHLLPGIALLAALLTLNMDPASAFVALANVLNRPTPLSFALGDAARVQTVYANVLKLMQLKVPHLAGHLVERLGLQPEEFLKGILEGFCCAGMSVDAASRVWDVVVFEGDRGFVRVAVAVLKGLEPGLYGEREEILGVLGEGAQGKKWVDVSGDEFIAVVRDCGKVH